MSLTNLEKQQADFDSLNEIFDAIGFGESLQDGAYGYSFHNKELQNAFKATEKISSYIKEEYEKLEETLG